MTMNRMWNRVQELLPYFVSKKGNNRLSGDLSSESYVAGQSGWSLFSTGDGEINNVTIRGEMHAGAIVSDEMVAHNGASVWAKGATKLLEDAVVDTTFTIVAEESQSGHFAFAQVGDILRSRDWQTNSVYDVWYTVTSVVDNGTSFSYNVTKNSGSNVTLPAGSVVINYGTASQGLLFAVANLSGSPYFDVRTNTSTPWVNYGVIHARMGLLDGLAAYGVIGSNEWGAMYGTDLSSTSAASASILLSNKQMSIRNVTVTLHNGTSPTVVLDPAGTLKMGTNTASVSTTGFSFDASTGNLLVGQIAGNYMQWNQSAGTITFSGALSAATGSFSGSITSTSGTIGGWTIGATTLTGGSATLGSTGVLTLGTSNDVAVLSAADSTFRLWIGNATAGSAPFRVSKLGAVTATSGLIGGWTLGSTSLTAGSGSTTTGVDSGGANPAFYAGSATPGSAPFRVTQAGALTATSGSVGGWTLGSTTLVGGNVTLSNTGVVTVGTSSDVAILSAADATFRLWIGNSSAASAPFRVTKSGALTATGVDVTGAINASSGSITGKLLMSGVSSAIALGVTPPTSASAGTGIWLDRTGLYGLASSVVQAKLDAVTGSITAGSGKILLNASGMVIDADGAGWIVWKSSGNTVGQVYSGRAGLTNSIGVNATNVASAGSIRVGGSVSDSGVSWIELVEDNPSADFRGVFIGKVGGTPVATLDVYGTGRVTGSVNIGSHLLRISGSGTQDIGSAGTPFDNLYVNSITASTIVGTMAGAEWEYAGNLTIDANVASSTSTVYVVNQAAGGIANLDVENNIIVGGFTAASRLVSHSAGKVLQTVSDLTAWVAGTTNQVSVANDGDGSITLSAPQNIHTGATPTFARLTLSQATGTAPMTISSTTVVTNLSADHVNKTITPGNGLTGGGALTSGTGVTLTVGAGAGITVNASDVALTTPGSLTATSTNSSSGNHTHAIDSTIARSAITITAGNGLTGGGDLTANRTLTVGAGTLITVGSTTVGLSVGTAQYQMITTGASPFTPAYTAMSTLAGNGLSFSAGALAVGAGTLITVGATTVGLSNGSAQYQVPVTGSTPFTPSWTALSTYAGNGLTWSSNAYTVGAGTLITVGATSVGISAGATYQFIGTGAGTSASWINLSTLAGNGLSHSAGVLSVGAGAGITVGVADVSLTTPGTLTAITTNSSSGSHTHAITTGAATTLSVSTTNAVGSSASLARADHLHTITSSSNPGAAASLLATDASGYLTLVRLRTDTIVDRSGANLTISPAGDIILDPTGDDVLPGNTYDVNIGSVAKKYLTVHAAELWVETLVAQETIATIGGRILVGQTTTLTSDLSSAATTMSVKHNNFRNGDIGYMEANGQLEFIRIASNPSGSGPYTYTIVRNLDGTGAGAWVAGDAIFNTGTTGNGFIDLYSLWSINGRPLSAAYNWSGSAYSVDYSSSASWSIFGNGANNAVNDAVYFGVTGTSWSNLYFNIVTAGVYSATITWEYWNGTAWTSFVPTVSVGSATAPFKNAGAYSVTWGTLSGWAATTINSLSAFWVRARISAFTSWTTLPVQGDRKVRAVEKQYGPTIAGNVRASNTWNDFSERWAIGNLDGLYDYGVDTYGAAFGNPAATWLSMDDTNGIRITNGATQVGRWDTSGNITVGIVDTAKSNIYISTSGTIDFRTNTTSDAQWDTSGGIRLGRTTDEHMLLTTTSLQFKNASNVDINLTSAGVLTLGRTDSEHVVLSTTSLQFKNGSNVDVDLTSGGTLTLGRTSALRTVITTSSVLIGDAAGENLFADAAGVYLRNSSTVIASLAGSVLTLGDVNNEHTLVNTSGVALKDGATVYALFAATSNIGVTSGRHVLISPTSVQIKDAGNVYADLTSGALTLGLTSTGDYITVDGTNGLRMYNNSTVSGHWKANGDLVIGEIANSKSRIEITSGSMNMINRSSGAVDTTVFSLSSAGAVSLAGALTVGTSGSIGSGASSYASGTGIWIEHNSGTPRMRIGTTAGNRLTWDGTTLTIAGNGSGITSIDGGNITANTVTATQIAALTITANEIAAATITGAKIAANTITATQIAATTITAAEIAAGTITGAKIAATTITAGNIAAGTITATQLAANSVTATQIAAGAVTATKISVTDLAAVSATMGTLTMNGVVTLSSGGGLYAGTGSFASPTTGIKLWHSGSVGQIAGYNSGVAQFYAGTDGRLYAGGGSVSLDANGISLEAGTGEPNMNTWKQGGTKLVEHRGYRSGASSPYMTYHQIFAKAFDASSRSTIDLWAYYGTANVAGISLVAWSATDKRVNLLGTTAQWNGTNIGLFRPLTTPLTSTSWDGDSFSTVSTSTLIDLSAVFGAPGGIKAVLAAVTLRDSAAWGSGEYWLGLGPSSTYFYAGTASCYGGDLNGRTMLVIPCDSNGDIYYRTNASGTNTLEIFVRIWGYWY